MAAGRRIRIGVAGLGRAFTLMLPTFQKDKRIELVAACDPREAARVRFMSDFKVPAYADIDALAADPAVEAIYIASPHQFHATHTRVAARHGKHVLVEKPMALSLAECDDMIASCASAGVQLIVGHCHSFDTPYLQTRQIVERREFGAVKMIQALNYTDYLYRPRRPEELVTAQGGGAIYSQASHQVDIVRLLAASRVTRVRAVLGNWDSARPTEGAYAALLWFENGSFANIAYSGYGHFDSDEWCDWTGEMGNAKRPADYSKARQRLAEIASPTEEAKFKNAATYGGPGYRAAADGAESRKFQHFGPVIVSCEHADIRPMPDGLMIYGDMEKAFRPLPTPAVPRAEVIDALHAAVVDGVQPLHDGAWSKATLEICAALLRSGGEQRDVVLD
ncbi:gfo/Idh/MocA family oxidoreductase [Oxalobacteraceae bacterium CAVE-383]|nr:gfo/Idh/MocA family oxidoreductase [Oxalobacteraceae bacterium CAVE-383]